MTGHEFGNTFILLGKFKNLIFGGININIDDNDCRILTNARCLSEGVDVPALDAVMFLNPRSSMVDIIQSVGRVMRRAEGKKYGYVILPIGVSANENPEDALDNNEKYKMVWQVLQALRAHDDRFNNTINKVELNKKKPDQIEVIGIGSFKKEDSDKGVKTKTVIDSGEIRKRVQLELDLKNFDEWKENIYSKMVKKVGSRVYWETWAKDIAEIAQTHIDRIKLILNKHDEKIDKYFDEFLVGLKLNLNNSIEREDAIEMLSQHMITKPVFDALFEGYEFVNNNPVSQVMQKMMDVLDEKIPDEEREKLAKFYDSVKERAAGIDNAEGKQKIILELYEKFFKTALPREVEKLGIVYTPTECVDFIINSVEYLMKKEFGKSLSDHGVHIIDGFTGTGTFIVRLLQSGVIKKEDLLYKYTNEIHANEIVLLAYYIAAINIEETFHELSQIDGYIPFEGIVLTDTFQLYEDSDEHEWTQSINEIALPQNSERAKKQRKLPITVCIGNPPYSVGQKSQNDNAMNMEYPNLNQRLSEPYVKNTNVSAKKSLYDSYVKAFRWASDLIKENGIVSFITNGAFIDNVAFDGFRKCLIEEFNSIYVFNLRGNARTSGELRQKEGGGIFNQGSRTPVAITCLVKNSSKEKDNYIHYCDIGDYLSRERKLSIIRENVDVSNVEWKKIIPDENNDWINKRSKNFEKFTKIEPTNKFDEKTKSFFTTYSLGIATAKDSFLYNYSSSKLINNSKSMIDFYNLERERYNENPQHKIKYDVTKIVWTDMFLKSLKRNDEFVFEEQNIGTSLYRPFCKQKFLYQKELIQRTYQMKKIYPDVNTDNLVIGVQSIASKKDFSCLISNSILDLHCVGDTQCFPLYWYEERVNTGLFESDGVELIRHDGISDSIQKNIQIKYGKVISKEDIFYYVYGLLHSKDYINSFAADLTKMLPRIPFVDDYETFDLFVEAGKKLANLHLNYEKIKPYDKCNIITYPDANYYVTKMKFSKKGQSNDKSIIEYNDKVFITNIPLKAYNYIVNGKSAIEWVMERYAVAIDKKSEIKNNPNDWCKEVNDEKYIFNLLLRIINVSIKTVDIINSLPKLDFE